MPREKIKFALRISPETQQLVKEMCPRDNCRTQNEFIERAIRFYAGYVSGQEATAYLPPALASVLRGTVQDTEPCGSGRLRPPRFILHFFRPPGSPAHFGDADFLSFATRPRRAACQSGGAGMLPCRAGRHTGASLWRTAGEQERGPLRIGNGP